MKGFTYILLCSDQSYYIGSTKNIDLRVWQHRSGLGASYTKHRLPITLVYLEEFERIDEAFYREKQLQGWSKKKKQALINSDFNRLKKAASCQNESHYGDQIRRLKGSKK